MTPEEQRAVDYLRSPVAIRERCGRLLELAEQDQLPQFTVQLDRLDAVAERVAELTRERYPDLKIPYHSRWRHFDVGGVGRLARLEERLKDLDVAEAARARFGLAVTSVLLDAGAGPRWRYTEDGEAYGRSEGLALASFHLFLSGGFSSSKKHPLRVDAEALEQISAGELGRAFQVSDANPLVGLEGRVKLLRGLGGALRASPAMFGEDPPRLGRLYDHLRAEAQGDRLPARSILAAVLEGLGSIWPGRVEIGGVNLGDVWPHPSLSGPGPGDRYVPFHKLSQWLTYSLLEPLEAAGVTVEGLGELTALAEYRNAGLLLDLGVLVPRDPKVLGRSHLPASPLIVAWRALAVALTDRVAERVRAKLGLDAESFPLAKVLEGGTWAAGRAVARELREDGSPPITLESDGTVF